MKVIIVIIRHTDKPGVDSARVPEKHICVTGLEWPVHVSGIALTTASSFALIDHFVPNQTKMIVEIRREGKKVIYGELRYLLIS